MRLELVKKRKYYHFEFYFDFDFDIVKKLKKIPGARYVPSKQKWTAPVNFESAKRTEAVINDIPSELGDGVIEKIQEYKRKRGVTSDLPHDDMVEGIDIPEFPGDLSLLKLQEYGACYMFKKKRCINADDMGTGKTIQSIAACEIGDIYPLIVVCPSVAVKTWRSEIKKWIPHRSHCSFATQFYHGEDISVINFEMVEKRFDDLKRLGAKGLIVDESHMVKNKSAGRTKAVRKLAEGIEYRFCLSGTVVENKPKELIPQLQIINRLADLGGYMNFVREYCDKKETPFGTDTSGASNLKRLNRRLKDVCMIRRLKKDVDKELKGKSEPKIVLCNIDNEEDYKKAEQDPVQWGINERTQKKQEKGLLFDFAKEEKVEIGAIDLVMINALKTEAMRGKKNFCADWIRRFQKRYKKEKLVVFSARQEMQHFLKREFNALSIMADDTPEQKFKKKNIFQEDDGIKIIVCSMKAANFNITLTESRNVLFTDLGWTSTIHDQCEDRCFRIGQKHFVNCWYAIAQGTIEEDIFELIQDKRDMVSQVQDGTEVDYDSASVFNELRKRINTKYDFDGFSK